MEGSVLLPSLIGMEVLWQEESISKHMGGVGAWIIYENANFRMKIVIMKLLVSSGMKFYDFISRV